MAAGMPGRSAAVQPRPQHAGPLQRADSAPASMPAGGALTAGQQQYIQQQQLQLQYAQQVAASRLAAQQQQQQHAMAQHAVAQQQQAQQGQQGQPAAPDPATQSPAQLLAAAIGMLVPLLGPGSERTAEEALRAVLESKPGCDRGNMADWVEEAQLWMANNMEQDAEIEKLRKAMADSLAEAERQKASAAPALDLEPFKATYLLQQVSRVVCSTLLAERVSEEVSRVVCPTLLAERMSEEEAACLVKFMQLETRCTKQWYPVAGTRYHFHQLASEVAAELARIIQSTTAAATSASAPSANGNSSHHNNNHNNHQQHPGQQQQQAGCSPAANGRSAQSEGAAGPSTSAAVGSGVTIPLSVGVSAGGTGPASEPPMLRCAPGRGCAVCGCGGGGDGSGKGAAAAGEGEATSARQEGSSGSGAAGAGGEAPAVGPSAGAGKGKEPAAAAGEADGGGQGQGEARRGGAVWRQLKEVIQRREAQVRVGLAEMPPAGAAAQQQRFVPSIFKLPEGVLPPPEVAGSCGGVVVIE